MISPSRSLQSMPQHNNDYNCIQHCNKWMFHQQHHTMNGHDGKMNYTASKLIDRGQQIRALLEPSTMKMLAVACERVLDTIMEYYGGNLEKQQSSNHQQIGNIQQNQLYKSMSQQMRQNNKGYIQLASIIQTNELKQVLQKYLPASYMHQQTKSSYIKHKIILLRRAILDHSSRLWANYNSVRFLNQYKQIQTRKQKRQHQLIAFVDDIQADVDQWTVLWMLGFTKGMLNAELLHVQFKQYQNQEYCDQQQQEQYQQQDKCNHFYSNQQQFHSNVEQRQMQQMNQAQMQQSSKLKQSGIIKTKKCAYIYLEAKRKQNVDFISQHHELVNFILKHRPNIEYNHKIRVLLAEQMTKNDIIISEITESLRKMEIDEIQQSVLQQYTVHQQTDRQSNDKYSIIQHDNSLFF